MQMRKITLVLLLVVFSLLAGSVASAQVSSVRSYLILSNGNRFPNNLAQQIAAAGGTVTRTIPEVGIVVVSSANPNFSSQIQGVRSVVTNAVVQWINPVEDAVLEEGINPPTTGDDDFFFDLQWGHDGVNAPEAWAAGHRGDGVRVAVLDSGIDDDHPDIVPNLNVALSTSFVPGETFDIAPGFYFNHGTHVAGTIGAADNAFGVIGVAPDVELVAVKVLSEFTGSGSFEGVIAGIVYAANIDADIINMSLGAVLQRSGFLDDMGTADPSDDVFVTAHEVAELFVAVSRATTYAYQQGTLVIASAGNEANDGDHTADVFHLPSDATHGVSIAATGPVGWGIDPTTDLNVPAFYTNFGRSVIDFAAPGGNVDFSLRPSGPNSGPFCTVAGVTRRCWVFDLVFSTISEGWGWAAGTSMAAPHTSGVAAIIIGENGGDMNPAHVERELRARTVGQGNDPFHGAGDVNTGY
jgi:subtilisin family serine protease